VQLARSEIARKRGTEQSAPVLDGWRAAGGRGSLDGVLAEPFWASMEPTQPHAAFESTERFLDQLLSRRV
jgi:hypothetical protein